MNVSPDIFSGPMLNRFMVVPLQRQGGGLKTFDETTTAEGCLILTAETKGLRNEAPACDPLK